MRKLACGAIAALALGTVGVAQAGTLSFTSGVVTYAAAASEGNRVASPSRKSQFEAYGSQTSARR